MHKLRRCMNVVAVVQPESCATLPIVQSICMLNLLCTAILEMKHINNITDKDPCYAFHACYAKYATSLKHRHVYLTLCVMNYYCPVSQTAL